MIYFTRGLLLSLFWTFFILGYLSLTAYFIATGSFIALAISMAFGVFLAAVVPLE